MVYVVLLFLIQHALITSFVASYVTSFSPEYLAAGPNGEYLKYENTPLIDNGRNDGIQRWGSYSASSAPDPEVLAASNGLNDYQLAPALHYGNPPGNDSIMGVALYRNYLRGFKRVVGSLRRFGYDGHIILGVHPLISETELNYLRQMQVTAYIVNSSACSPIAHTGTTGGMLMRGKCTSDLPDLKVEWGRFELARRWLHACMTCTGWSMVMDVRDIFFQDNPFGDLGRVRMTASGELADLLFIEEISPYSSPLRDPSRAFVAGNHRNQVHTVPCYGKELFVEYKMRPVLCSGTVFGTREGMLRFLVELVSEFNANNRKKNVKCKSPHTTDQWIMNYMYYNGQFGVTRVKTIPWGVGPVLTAGKACMTQERKQGARDILTLSSGQNPNSDIDTSGFVINRFDKKIAPVVHQFDRCGEWLQTELILKHPEIYNA